MTGARRWAAVAVLALLGAMTQGCSTGRGARTAPSVSAPPSPAPGHAFESSPTTSVGPLLTAPAPTTTVAPSPPYQVVSTAVPFVDPSRPTVSHGVRLSAQRALTTVVWYPTAPGPWPLVVFAAGFRVGPETYTDLLRSWATAGYFVAAPQFPLEDQGVAGANLDEADLPNEPADVNFVIRALTAPAERLSAQIAASGVAVAGHSDGAEVALAVAQSGNPPVRAAIIMSGQTVAGGTGHNPPILVIQGSADTVNPPSLGQAVYAQSAQPRYYVDLLGAAHLPPFSGTAPWAGVVESVTVDFLNRYLGGHAGTDTRLRADGSHPGVATITAGTSLTG